MKTTILSTLIVIAALLTGCANLSDGQRASPITASELAAYNGTKITLIKNPAHRPGFELASAELQAMIDGEIDRELFVQIINRLPVKELHGEMGDLIIENASIILKGQILATPLEKLENLRPYVIAIHSGIERGLGH